MAATAPFRTRGTISRTRNRPDPTNDDGRIDRKNGEEITDRHRRASPRAIRGDVPNMGRYEFSFEPHVLPKRMLYVVLGLLLAHFFLALIHFQVYRLPWLLRQLFDLDQENNIPSWYSGTALFVTTIFIWLCAREKKAVDDPWTRQWYILAFAFFFLAIDEIAGIHETFNTLITMSWAIPGGLLACLGALILAPFLLKLPRRTAALFALSGLVYFGGAVGMELLAAPLNSNSLRYYMMTLWEEGLEMLGVVLFLYALLSYMSGEHPKKVELAAELGRENTPA